MQQLVLSSASRWGTGVAAAVLCLCGVAVADAVKAGKAQPRISDVIIQNNQILSTEQIKAHLETRVGTDYDPGTIRGDMARLYKTRQFLNIKVLRSPNGPGRCKVFFIVEECPNKIKKVQYLGAKHLKDSELHELTPGVGVGQPLNPDANRRGCANIVKKLNDDGRPHASCQLLKGGHLKDDEVIFQITEGPKVAVHSVCFEGCTFVSSQGLAAQVKTSGGFLGLIGGSYHPAMVFVHVDAVEKYYKKHGFLKVQVSVEQKWTLDGNGVDLIFHIKEGDRYRIASAPRVVGNVQVCPREQLESYSRVKPGGYFNEETIEADKQTIKDFYGYRGQDVDVKVQKVFDTSRPGVVRIKYQVQEKAPSRSGETSAIGNEPTCSYAIIRHAP